MSMLASKLMIRRSTFDKYCDQHDHPQFKLNKEVWQQIDYLCITQPFYKFTTGFPKTKDLTLHDLFRGLQQTF